MDSAIWSGLAAPPPTNDEAHGTADTAFMGFADTTAAKLTREQDNSADSVAVLGSEALGGTASTSGRREVEVQQPRLRLRTLTEASMRQPPAWRVHGVIPKVGLTGVIAI